MLQVTPMVVIIGGLVVFVSSACTYFMATKSDVMVDRKRRWESVNLDNPAPQKYERKKNIGCVCMVKGTTRKQNRKLTDGSRY
ncbi:hypothetical protein B566_EDAN010962, partial [Ephemera danica]